MAKSLEEPHSLKQTAKSYLKAKCMNASIHVLSHTSLNDLACPSCGPPAHVHRKIQHRA